MTALPPDVEAAHEAAASRGRDTYTDPRTGLTVFTAAAALRRGYCCGRGCRHCPFAHMNVPEHERRVNAPGAPVLLPAGRPRDRGAAGAPTPGDELLRVLFWSGGKDSYLALRRVTDAAFGGDAARAKDGVVLLTTFDARTRRVPEQNVALDDVVDQATKRLAMDLVLVPLPSAHVANDEYVALVRAGLEVARASRRPAPARLRLVFGDLHLADIRAWREATFSAPPLVETDFPLFGAPYAELADALFSSPQVERVTLTSVSGSARDAAPGGLREGDAFDRDTYARLSAPGSPVDAFGERGEFHTFVWLR